MPVLGPGVLAERLLADVSVPDADAVDRAVLVDLPDVDAAVLIVDVLGLVARALVQVAAAPALGVHVQEQRVPWQWQ